MLSITTDELSTDTPIKPATDLALHRRHAGLRRTTGGGTAAVVESSGVERTKKRCSTQLEQRAQTKTIDLIHLDSECLLTSTGGPNTTWRWDWAHSQIKRSDPTTGPAAAGAGRGSW